MIFTETISFSTQGNTDIIDITKKVEKVFLKSSITDGIATVFVFGSTASVTTIEYESGLIYDLKQALERIAPKDDYYEHDERWGDGNGFSHIRASLLGPSLSVPISKGALLLGTWQQIILIDFDNRPRERKIIVQIMGGGAL